MREIKKLAGKKKENILNYKKHNNLTYITFICIDTDVTATSVEVMVAKATILHKSPH